MKSMLRSLVAASLLVGLVAVTPAHAKGGGGSSRTENRFGLTVGLFADPFPNMAGFSLRVNVTSFFQLHAGYGTLSLSGVDPSTGGSYTLSTKTYGGGGRFFIPGWSFSPYVGFTYAKWDATGDVTLSGQTITTGSGLPAVMYLTFGLDWQTYFGFNIGAGVHYILAPTQLADALAVSPNIYIGWYF